MRYLVPFFLITILLSSLVLARQSIFHFGILIATLVLAALTLLAWRLEAAKISNRVLTLPYYFVLANLASLLAFYKFLTGERYARWEPIRDQGQHSPGSSQVSVPVTPEGSGQ